MKFLGTEFPEGKPAPKKKPAGMKKSGTGFLKQNPHAVPDSRAVSWLIRIKWGTEFPVKTLKNGEKNLVSKAFLFTAFWAQ